jgi:hypothetical protein
MNWLEQLGGVLQQYSDSTQGTQNSAEQDFDQVSTVAPREAVAGGLADAFRSNDTPPFPNMLGQLFGNSNGTQRANILNSLLASVGPALLSGALSRAGGGGLGSLAGMLGGGGMTQITPEQAQQIPPQAVEEIAKEAEQQDPSVIDRVSDFYAEHPTLVKGLGAAALAIAMRGMAKQKRGMF